LHALSRLLTFAVLFFCRVGQKTDGSTGSETDHLAVTCKAVSARFRFWLLHGLYPQPPPPLLAVMAETLYSSFADVLSVSQSVKDDLEALLDSEDGFAPRLRQICEDQ
jgi:hypothetical protein